MLVHRRVILLPPAVSSPVPIYTMSYTFQLLMSFCYETKSKVSCRRPGLESGPFDPESSALTIRPPRLPQYVTWININTKLFSLQLAWRRSQNPVLIPNPNQETGRSPRGTMSPKCASNSAACLVQGATEQNPSLPLEGTVKILEPPPPHQENPGKGRFPRTERFGWTFILIARL